MEFQWDPAKAEAHRRKHGVAFEEAVTIFADPYELMIYDPNHSITEDRFVSIGMSAAGQMLVVGYTERGSKIRIIFARRAAGPEMLDYEEV